MQPGEPLEVQVGPDHKGRHVTEVLSVDSSTAVPTASRRSNAQAATLNGPWVAALDSLAQFERIEVLYWLDLSRRDLVMQSPANDGTSRGTFSLRSPARPNPIGTSIVKLVSIEGPIVMVRGLDCPDGTPLLDLKPDRCLFTPVAPPQPGDFQVGDP